MGIDLIEWVMIVFDWIYRIACFRMNFNVPMPKQCLEWLNWCKWVLCHEMGKIEELDVFF